MFPIKEITQEYLHTLFEYKDGFLFLKHSIYKSRIGKKSGTINAKGYSYTWVNGKKILTHRLIYAMHYGNFPKYIDHINGNSLDNDIKNLREVTHSQNMQNSKIPENNTSGIKGVCWHTKSKKWKVRLSVNNKNKHLGMFDNLELAELVVIEARNKYHGNYARNI